LTESGIAFAADEPAKTGAYITLSCYYFNAGASTPVPVLDPFGSFTVFGQTLFSSCPANSHIVAVHPALAGLTDADLSNWSCSTHEAFDSFPADFLVLAINSDIGSTFTAPDGTVGGPYILARGETLSPILCGDGTVGATEECDDGNTTNGDGCSAQCTIEEPTGPVCGNGVVESGEQCDDGNLADGDGCSSVCTIENAPPVCTGAVAGSPMIWPPNHQMVPVSVLGVTDPDGDAVTITATSVTQDEPVLGGGQGAGNTSPDASLSPLAVRAERNGNPKTPGNGRVYHISFTATDPSGDSCSGVVSVCVPHDQRPGAGCVDGGPLYPSIP
jgi:cysteine-rich repeat protein